MPADPWLRLWTLAGIAFAVAVTVTGVVLRIARRHSLLDVPNERSSHSVPTPRSGGLGIVAGVVIAMSVSKFRFPTVIAVVLLTCAVGLWDDRRGLSPRIKMLGLAVGATILVWGSVSTWHVHVPFAGTIGLGLASVPLVGLWLACYPNAFNFMDGLNGIAGLTAVVSGVVFTIAGWEASDLTLCVMGSAVAAASLGFLPWNFPRARIFMGDAGSLPLGLMLAVCASRAHGSEALPFPASILLLGPFIFDVSFTLIRRASRGARLGEAHKEHLYQRLSRVWNSHAKVSLLYAGFSVVTGVLALNYGGFGEMGKLLSLTLPLAAMLGFAALVLRAERSKGG